MTEIEGSSASAEASDLLAKALEGLGGRDELRSVNALLIVAEGQRLEPEQALTPGKEPRLMANFQYTLTQDLTGDRLRVEWDRNTVYPAEVSAQFTEIIDGDQGFVDGVDDWFVPEPQKPMPSARLTTVRKLHTLASPLLLIRTAAEHPDLVKTQGDEQFRGKLHHVITLAGDIRPIRVLLDVDTFLPAKADTVEDDPLYGDALYEVIYDDWRQVDGVKLPFKITHKIQGRLIQAELRSEIRADVQPAAETFSIPAAMRRPFDPDDALRGERSSQWFFRFSAMGFNLYMNQTQSPVTLSEIAPGVHWITGGTHHNLVIEMEDHLIVVEAPLHEDRSQAVISEIRSRWPGKPIRYLVTTHFHGDHAGGTRAYVAEGATVVTGAVNKEHFEEVVRAPHTLQPDALQRNPREVRLETVSTEGKKILSDGKRSVEIYPVQTSHSEGALAVFLPREKLLFVSDIFQPQLPQVGPPGLWPRELLAVVTRHDLEVEKIAGGHGMGVASMGDLLAAANPQHGAAAP